MFVLKILDSDCCLSQSVLSMSVFNVLLIAFSIELGFPPPLEEILSLFGVIYTNTFLLLINLLFPKCFSWPAGHVIKKSPYFTEDPGQFSNLLALLRPRPRFFYSKFALVSSAVPKNHKWNGFRKCAELCSPRCFGEELVPASGCHWCSWACRQISSSASPITGCSLCVCLSPNLLFLIRMAGIGCRIHPNAGWLHPNWLHLQRPFSK